MQHYPISLATQLREHLRALRKVRGLTQAQLGERLGIKQARVAEIEAHPGLVSVEQLMRVLSVLRVSLVIEDTVTPLPGEERVERVEERLEEPVEARGGKGAMGGKAYYIPSKKGSW